MATSSALITAKSQEPCDTTKAMPFLDLAAELRNLIYEHISDTTPLRLPHQTQEPKLVNPSPMLLVNKQIAKEYHDLALISATIEIQVIDFDFDHVIAYLDGLSDKDAARLTRNPPTQTIRFELWAAPPVLGWVKIIPWLEKFKETNDIASKIGLQYVWNPSAGKSGARPKVTGGDIHLLVDALEWMEGKDRAWKELGKIKAALELGVGLCKG
ncbi:hypothetical protein M409DRAFT_50742 [Zasmidium cellare ATCC 36951]|uniref:Uncharacterized protein n=1 Tax=Zasmidium cellare ATCC 36951 TaxID=1080233 RepID=A0A6A6CVR6_ZASCE|nr:uncharacterized protein M409DRAFT_50742 [Zasmidium cellare ATCC 36951]KAF2171277.1 hypothetical protein M409DRAFT_50742 [Zasmidium cellare ATCC 36951]